MTPVDQFRRRDMAERLAGRLGVEASGGRAYRVMELCGGHADAIARFGLQDLMPEGVRFMRGPGCPVCALPVERIGDAMALGERHGAILCVYGQLMQVPVRKRRGVLKSKGVDIRPVGSIQDALRIARDNADRQVVFLAVGFETTAAPTAVALKQARAEGLGNFSVHCNHLLTPPAIQHILESPKARHMDAASIDGFLAPAHASPLIGSDPYRYFADEFQRPVVIAGPEPLDVLQATLMVVRQVNEGRHEVENQYRRVVTADGNRKAQAVLAEVFELRRSFEWRGLGEVPYSAFRIRAEFADLDAEKRFQIAGGDRRGKKKPADHGSLETICAQSEPGRSCFAFADGAVTWSDDRYRQGRDGGAWPGSAAA